MKQIVKAFEIASKIIKYKKTNSDYSWSRYVVKIAHENGLLLYSTLTGELFLLDKDELKLLDNKDPKLLEILNKKSFIVPNDLNEYKLANDLKQIGKIMLKHDKAITKYIIFPTTDCNARCFYCYELGRKRINMDLNIANDVAEYIKDKSMGEKVNLQWFGGEPLYNFSAIDRITELLNKWNIDYSSIMVSNGYLFNEELIKRAKDLWHLNSVQISLDGREELYNKVKNYIHKGTNPYLIVLNNIELLLKTKVEVIIRLNMDNQNVDELNKLSDDLINYFGDYNNLDIYTVLIRDFGYSIHEFNSEDEALNNYSKLQEKLTNAGFCKIQRLKHDYVVNQCMADNDKSITILPDGRLGKCEHESEDNLIGSIYDNKLDESMIKEWKETIVVDECKECVFFPSCVRLKKCAWNSSGCVDTDRKEMHINLRQKMINEYNKFMKQNEGVN